MEQQPSNRWPIKCMPMQWNTSFAFLHFLHDLFFSKEAISLSNRKSNTQSSTADLVRLLYDFYSLTDEYDVFLF